MEAAAAWATGGVLATLSWGRGIWFAPLTRTNAVSLSVAGSDDETLVYVSLGFQL